MLLAEIGRTWYDRGEMFRARQYNERAELVLRDANITNGPACAYLRLRQSYIYWREGNYHEAHKSAHEALSLFTDALEMQKSHMDETAHLSRTRSTLAGDHIDLGRTHSLMSLIANDSGRSTDALSHLDMALTLYEQYDSVQGIAIACCNLGDVYLKKADYSKAQSVLRRSLNLAERMGDAPNMAFVFGNLALLDMRTGNLVEAEGEFRKAIALVEYMKDPISSSMFLAVLATVLQEQKKLSEAGSVLRQALSAGRPTHVAPCIGLALVSLGGLRLAQAKAIEFDEIDSNRVSEMQSHLLMQAKKTLQHALALEGIYAETKTESRLVLAQVLLLQGEVETAQQQAEQALEEARQSELTWLFACAQRILGDVSTMSGRQEQADAYFDQALRTFRKSGMRLEYARTLQAYGEILLQRDDVMNKRNLRSLEYLHEARQIFIACKAELELQLIERVLAQYETVSKL